MKTLKGYNFMISKILVGAVMMLLSVCTISADDLNPVQRLNKEIGEVEVLITQRREKIDTLNAQLASLEALADSIHYYDSINNVIKHQADSLFKLIPKAKGRKRTKPQFSPEYTDTIRMLQAQLDSLRNLRQRGFERCDSLRDLISAAREQVRTNEGAIAQNEAEMSASSGLLKQKALDLAAEIETKWMSQSFTYLSQNMEALKADIATLQRFTDDANISNAAAQLQTLYNQTLLYAKYDELISIEYSAESIASYRSELESLKGVYKKDALKAKEIQDIIDNLYFYDAMYGYYIKILNALNDGTTEIDFMAMTTYSTQQSFERDLKDFDWLFKEWNDNVVPLLNGNGDHSDSRKGKDRSKGKTDLSNHL